jgi:Tol biopolymer transport system component
VSVSDSGAIAFIRGGLIDSELVRVDRAGKELGRVPNLRGQFSDIRIAPDGQRLAAVQLNNRFMEEIVEVDIERGTSMRLATEGQNYSPIWSRDGTWLIFASGRDGYLDLYRVRAGGGQEERILEVRNPFTDPACLSPDNRDVIYCPLNATTGRDIWSCPIDDPSKATPILVTNSNDSQARISPNGKLIAYLSDQAGGSSQVFIRPYPINQEDRAWQATTDGGGSDVYGPEGLLSWNPDGTELIYLMPDGHTMNALKVELGDEVQIDAPKTLFTYPGRIIHFCPAPDHQSIIIAVPVDATPGSIVVASDWKAYLDLGDRRP